MGQLFAHLIGDYIFQTDKMANLKTKSNLWAFIHAFTYTLPFLFLTQSVVALLIIMITHFFIDRFRLARYLIAVKNSLTEPDFDVVCDFWSTSTGYSSATPAFLAVWLFIITDNTIHLLTNYVALRWF